MPRVVLKVDRLDNIHNEEGEGARRCRRVGRSSSLKKEGLHRPTDFAFHMHMLSCLKDKKCRLQELNSPQQQQQEHISEVHVPHFQPISVYSAPFRRREAGPKSDQRGTKTALLLVAPNVPTRRNQE